MYLNKFMIALQDAGAELVRKSNNNMGWPPKMKSIAKPEVRMVGRKPSKELATAISDVKFRGAFTKSRRS